MKIYDISVTIPDAPVYPGDPVTKLHRAMSISDGAACNLTSISMCVHAGTHADAPLHFIDGAVSVDKLDPSLFCGEARVVTVYKEKGQIEADDLIPLSIKRGERLLFKTRNSIDGHICASGEAYEKDFYMNFCAFAPSAAGYLAEHGAALVGIDYASIGAGDYTVPTHKIILGSGIAALEWLNLGAVPDGNYFLSAAPLKIAGAEGAPVRALLFDNIDK
jgi:arylformamidase